MPRPSDLGLKYRSSVSRLRSCCSRIETLLAARRIGVRDCELIYESAFLNAIARFEGLLNHLLEEFVCGSSSGNLGHYTLVSARSRDVFRDVLTRGRPYVDMMPFDKCLAIAKRFLNEGKPFTDIDPADKHILGQAVLIRNAIAHRSDAALRRFRSDVSGISILPAHQQFPGALLRRRYRTRPLATWNDLYFDTLEKVGAQLATAW